MSSKIKISKELNEIFEKCVNLAKDEGLHTVSLERVLLQLLKTYSKWGIKHNPCIFSLLSPDAEKLKKAEKKLEELIKIQSECLKSTLSDEISGQICLDKRICDALDDSENFYKLESPRMDIEVGTDVFLAMVLNPVNGEDVNGDLVEIFKEIGIDCASLLKKVKSIDSLIRGAVDSVIQDISGKSSGGIVQKKSEDLFNESYPSSEELKEDEDNFEKYGESKAINGVELNEDSNTPMLDAYSVDMTLAAKDSKYDPVIGRDELIDSIIEVLCKRKKPNVCITGYPGVGKTSIVERLAQRIAKGEVPEKLINKRVCSLNLNDLVAGTKYRGEYEERLQKIIKEVCNSKNTIIYIDEFHNIVGNGSQAGSGDGANILKPYLTKGEFQCIGATTSEEYRKFIEKDKALERRFTCIDVTEPNQAETLKIAKALIPYYENFHKVKYSKEAIEMAVEWSSRYINDKHQPDKTIDILDMAGSMVELGVKPANELLDLRNTVEKLVSSRSNAVRKEKNMEKADELDKQLLQKREELEKIESEEILSKTNWPKVEENHIAACVSKVSRVPIDKIIQTDMKKLALMKEELEKRVIGQEKAVQIVIDALQRNILGLRNPKKPITTILACGPTGVGKTLMCKEIADIFFGSEKALIKIDGGTLKGSGGMAANSLLGSTAGYVGYGDMAVLEKVKKMPRCVLLFDEIEKADKTIYDTLLSIMDEGTVRLNNNEIIHFENCIIIFTSNLGAKEMKNKISLGFDNDSRDKNSENEEIVKKAIERNFKPEFINRLNSIVTFNELGEAELLKIFDIELKKLKATLNRSKISFKVSNKLKKHVVSLCKDGMGARELSRHIETCVLNPLSRQLLLTPDEKKYELTLGEDKTTIVK